MGEGDQGECPHLFSLSAAVIKHFDQNQLRGGKGLSGVEHVSSLRDIRAGT